MKDEALKSGQIELSKELKQRGLLGTQAHFQAVSYNALDASLMVGNDRTHFDANPAACSLLGLHEQVKEYAIFLLDRNGYVTSWNPAAEGILGYPASEIVGQHISRFYSRDDLALGKPQEDLKVAAREGELVDESWRVRKDRSRFWASAFIAALKDDSGRPRGFAEVLRDITDRRQAEQELRESEALFRVLFDGVLDAITITDNEGRCLDANPAACRLFGLPKEQVVGHGIGNLVEPHLTKQVLKLWEEFLKQGELRGLFRIASPDGTTREFEYASKAHFIDGRHFTIMREIGEQKRRPCALLRISEKLSATLDIDVLIDSLVIEAMKLTDAEIGWSGLRTAEGMVCRKYFRGSQAVPFEYCWPPGIGWPGWVLLHKAPGVSDDATTDNIIVPEIRERFGVKSGIITPILDVHGEVLGFCQVINKKAAIRFTKVDVDKLTAVSGIASIAIQNALACRRLRQAKEALLQEITNALISNLDIGALFNAIGACLDRAVQHEYASVALLDSRGDGLRTEVLRSLHAQKLLQQDLVVPLDGSEAGWVLTAREALVLTEKDAGRFPNGIVSTLLAAGMKSACWLPLISLGRGLGVLIIASLREDTFTRETVNFLSQVANAVALAIDNALAFRRRAFEEIVGESAALTRILKEVETVASTDATVLIQGETGTGKELIAHAIHNLSPRRKRPFVVLNCAAIPAGLLESELFGYEKGAFTGAVSQRVGRLERAHQGTLFLDEVGDIPLEIQSKLLRVLQEKSFERLGSTRTIPVDVRLVAATNRSLAKMVEDQQFRSDLYYRLHVFPITAPPLRDRKEDIPILVRYFVHKSARHMGRQIDTIPAEALAAISRWHWPGNVRELENFIERAVILSQGRTLCVPLGTLKASPAPTSTAGSKVTLELVEREHILCVLRETAGVIGGPRGAAARLGLKRTTLNARMRKLGFSHVWTDIVT